MSGDTGRTAAPRSSRVPPTGRAEGGTRILCIGNTLMADDGVGAAVARAIDEAGLPEGCILDVRAHADMSIVGVLRSSDAVVVVDAVDVHAEPGSVFRFTPQQAGLTEMRSHNTHGMGLGYAVVSAKLMGSNTPVVVYGVQVGDVRPRPDSLSPAVAAAVPDVARMVVEEVANLAAQPSSRGLVH